MLETIVSIQPKDAAGGSGETRESVVSRLADDMLDKLPDDFVPHLVRERLSKMGHLQPLNIFLRQEIDRMQRVIATVRSTLTDLKLAIEGTIIMSENLRDALDNMFDARIPNTWKKVRPPCVYEKKKCSCSFSGGSYHIHSQTNNGKRLVTAFIQFSHFCLFRLQISWESATLGFWFTDLLDRHQQFYTWVFDGRPNVFWMTGFFNPQGFLTAMRQEITRAHKGWALDGVVLDNDVTKMMREDVTNPPAEGWWTVVLPGLSLAFTLDLI